MNEAQELLDEENNTEIDNKDNEQILPSLEQKIDNNKKC
jgi:hypothetical protein